MKFKIFFRTTGQFSTKLSTKHPWVKGIQICLNEGLLPFQMGDYNKIAKIHWRKFKILFFRPSGLISTKPGTKYPWVKGIIRKGSGYKIAKIHWWNSKSSLEPLGNFQLNLAQSILGWRGFRFVQMKGYFLSQWEIITK